MKHKLPVDAVSVKPTICTLEVRNTADIRTAAIELCKQSTQISLARQLVEVQVIVPMTNVVKVDEVVKCAQPEPCESRLAAETPLQMETRGLTQVWARAHALARSIRVEAHHATLTMRCLTACPPIERAVEFGNQPPLVGHVRRFHKRTAHRAELVKALESEVAVDFRVDNFYSNFGAAEVAQHLQARCSGLVQRKLPLAIGVIPRLGDSQREITAMRCQALEVEWKRRAIKPEIHAVEAVMKKGDMR